MPSGCHTLRLEINSASRFGCRSGVLNRRNQSREEAARAAYLWLLNPAMCVHDTVAHGQANDEIAGHQRQGAEQ